MNPRIIGALVLRYAFLYTRNWIRVVELIFWPTMELLLWGFLTTFIERQTTGDFPMFIRFLIGAMIFWDVLFRSQQAVAISFLEDVWTRNLLNVFVAPIRVTEYLAATFAFGMIRVTITVVLLAILAKLMYEFNLFDFQWNLIPFFANLLLFGWSLGMISTALIMRWGQAAEALAWAVPFMIQPFSAVFYPVDVLPEPLQVVAWMIPSTYVFEGMRTVLQQGSMAWTDFALATGMNLIFLVLAGAFFAFMYDQARQKGLLTKVASQ